MGSLFCGGPGIARGIGGAGDVGNIWNLRRVYGFMHYGDSRVAEIAEKNDVGLVFGKFYPLTKGHEYLIETAMKRCRRVYIGVSGRASETIPQEVRVGWIVLRP